MLNQLMSDFQPDILHSSADVQLASDLANFDRLTL